MLRLLYTEGGGSGLLRNVDTYVLEYTASLFYSEDDATATSEALLFVYQLQDVTLTQMMAASFSESSAVPVHTVSHPTIAHSALL
jgi:hypothetical protein